MQLKSYLQASQAVRTSRVWKDQEDHDNDLRGVLQRLQEYNVHLNKDKCSFSKTEVMFYGHVFSAEGIKLDPKKVEANKSATPPNNASKVKSLLGMAQYVFRYIPEYATVTLEGSSNRFCRTLPSWRLHNGSN